MHAPIQSSGDLFVLLPTNGLNSLFSDVSLKDFSRQRRVGGVCVYIFSPAITGTRMPTDFMLFFLCVTKQSNQW